MKISYILLISLLTLSFCGEKSKDANANDLKGTKMECSMHAKSPTGGYSETLEFLDHSKVKVTVNSDSISVNETTYKVNEQGIEIGTIQYYAMDGMYFQNKESLEFYKKDKDVIKKIDKALQDWNNSGTEPPADLPDMIDVCKKV